jgi:hypothetical protein
VVDLTQSKYVQVHTHTHANAHAHIRTRTRTYHTHKHVPNTLAPWLIWQQGEKEKVNNLLASVARRHRGLQSRMYWPLFWPQYETSNESQSHTAIPLRLRGRTNTGVAHFSN